MTDNGTTDKRPALRLERRVDRFKLAAFVQEWLRMMHFHYGKQCERDGPFEVEAFAWKGCELTEHLTMRSDSIYDSKFVFDETLWPPVTAEGRYAKRGMLCVKPVPSPEGFLFLVDFDKPIDQCVMLRGNSAGPMEDMPVNVFHVIFYDPENPEGAQT